MWIVIIEKQSFTNLIKKKINGKREVLVLSSFSSVKSVERFNYSFGNLRHWRSVLIISVWYYYNFLLFSFSFILKKIIYVFNVLYFLFVVIAGMTVQEHVGNERSCVWHASDYADGELKEMFCIRFASIESQFSNLMLNYCSHYCFNIFAFIICCVAFD